MAHTLKLDSDERIIREVRRHMFVFYADTLSTFLAALFPLLFISYIDQLLSRFFSSGEAAFGALYFLWVALWWMVFFMRWTDYYLDVWIVTNKRVFDIEQHGMFHRSVSAFELSRIQDITVEMRGLLATFLKFGDIKIHTAGEHKDIVIKTAANPIEVKNAIMDAQRSQSRTMHSGV